MIAPLFQVEDMNRTELPLGTFSVTIRDGLPRLWNIHHIRLDRMPVVDILDAKKVQWMMPHIFCMLSDRERKIQEEASANKIVANDTLVNVKGSLRDIFMMTVESSGRKSQIFGLWDPQTSGMHTLIFVADIRLDLASHAVVADAVVLSLNDELEIQHEQRYLNSL